MSDQNVKGKSKAELSPLQNKPKYESPTVVPLGELARGAGACAGGSGDVDTCTSNGGIANTIASTCTTTGVLATSTCTNGLEATVACTDAGGAV
jgi:hypothetical protein